MSTSKKDENESSTGNEQLTSQPTMAFHDKFSHSKVFGKKLPENPKDLPGFILQAMDYLDKHCMRVEGIFRLSPKKTNEEEVIQTLEDDIHSIIPFHLYEIHLPARLLKLYLMELPDPLLTFEHYGMFVAADVGCLD